ncbi:MAG: response regulator [Opitutales bacterium]|nr:response regulator [Opitutales bacterium]
MKPGNTILVIDDTPENLAVLFDVLAEEGFEVLVVESGEIALERMGVLQPDLILLDVRLPGLDGIEICRRLKADPDYAEVPVIILTALNETEDTIAGFSAGAVDYLCKPVEPQEVLIRVRTQLKIRQLHQALEERNRALSVEIRRRRAAERQIEQTLDLGIMVVSASGKVEFATKRAWDLLGRFHPEATFGLPDSVAAWLEARTGKELRVRRPEGVLIIRIQAGTTPGESRLLRIEENIALHDPLPLEQLGLTHREAEVLYWIAQGKSSPEIAAILDSALNTVKKHAQNIYHKLGVDNRTAAALRAVEILQSGDGGAEGP